MRRTWTALVLGLGLFLTAMAWTPSSYGVVLRQVGAEGAGLVWGTPQEVRSDEWAVWTPLVQATVNNDFQRHNTTSPYGEDLRNFNGLPLRDAALVFKPQFWAFFVLDPARAFAWAWALPLVAFLLGWERLLHRLGVPAAAAVAGSGLLWTTGYVQTWWTTTGPMLAFWPWVLLAALWEGPRLWRGVALVWTTACCLLTHLYPPLLIPLALVAGAMLVLAGSDRMRWAVTGAGVAGGAAVAGLYLGDAITAMAATLYPGQRVSSGGEVPWLQVADLVVPALSAWAGESRLDGVNVCEATTAGTFLPLLVLVVLDREALRWRWRDDAPFRHGLQALGVVLAGLVAWMVLPIPSWLGSLLLWDRVPPVRMLFPAGVVLLVGALLLPVRLPRTPLVVAAWAWSLFMWADFNPVQHAGPLFERPRTPVVEALETQAAADPRGWLVVPGYGGAVLNGYGFAAVSHALLRPQLDFFRERFPDMEAQAFEQVFQRFGHVQLYGGSQPVLVRQDVYRVPLAAFGPALEPLEVRVTAPAAARFRSAGWIDRVVPGEPVVVSGWGRLDGREPGRSLELITTWPIATAHAEAMLRPDVATATGDPGLGAAGFRLELTLDGPAEGPLCVVSDDPDRGRFLVQQVGAADPCAHLRRRAGPRR